jgi:hypothetical protein
VSASEPLPAVTLFIPNFQELDRTQIPFGQVRFCPSLILPPRGISLFILDLRKLNIQLHLHSFISSQLSRASLHPSLFSPFPHLLCPVTLLP